MPQTLNIPEIVAIGGQSDGKSSLLEAFLGVSPRLSACQAAAAGDSRMPDPFFLHALTHPSSLPPSLPLIQQFRFNITSSEMGTRRPLIVQMVHDPSALEPRCRLQEEDGDEYGAVRLLLRVLVGVLGAGGSAWG